ncbi:MAG: serine/threonine protein kinase [Butyrivibrio sp.]|nr:serine/threonine protein kinase [Butyrivibrio sp.]
MLEIGSLVDGKYKILNKIGQGGMSTVYLAMNERANKQWAIKEVRKDGVSNYQVVKQSLIVETDMLKSLSHPYLPSIVDVIDEPDRFLIVMDYIEGNTLLTALEEYGPQPQDSVIEWGKQLCDVMEYLHTRKPPIIYRDLKPGNIMLRPDGTITLIDFGTARVYKQQKSEDTTYLGTIGYAAPEQFGGRGQTDARTDIYCMGTTLYHLITGHNPCDPPYEFYPIRYWNTQLSPGLEKIISKCIQSNPLDRYQSCAEVLYDLQHYEELDKDLRKKYVKKTGVFFSVGILAIICLIISIMLGIKADNMEKRNYEYYLEEAHSMPSVQQQIEMYKKAIEVDPSREEAYIDMLEHVFLIDDNLEPSEDEVFRQIFITSYDSKYTYEEILQGNIEAYANVCYKMGLAYYYCYDGSGNKQMSYKWFGEAVSAGTLLTSQQLRAERLGRIAQYYSDLGRENISGDSTVSYKQYWDDLKEITSGDIAQIDNTTTALMIYKEMANQIYINVNKFKKEGISKQEMQNQLDNIMSRLETDIVVTDNNNADRINMLKLETMKNVDYAQKALDTAF